MPPADGPGTGTLYAVLENRVTYLVEDVRELKAELKSLQEAMREREKALEAREAERNRLEKQQLWLGIKTLIGIIGTLGTLIWAYRAIIIGSVPGN